MASLIDANTNRAYDLITKAWRAAPAAVGIPVPPAWPILYLDVDSDAEPKVSPGNTPWSRCSFNNTDGRPTSISGRRYRVDGILTLQVLISTTRSDAASRVRRIGEAIVSYVSQSRSEEFTITRANLVSRPREGRYFRMDVQLQIYWDEFRPRA